MAKSELVIVIRLDREQDGRHIADLSVSAEKRSLQCYGESEHDAASKALRLYFEAYPGEKPVT